MDDDVQRSEGRRSAAKRALRGAANPFVGYFDRRFRDVHGHLDDHTALNHLEAVMHGRFEHVLRELRDVRTDVAADTDTIAELAFTLERFADLFTARMEEIAGQITSATAGPADGDAGIVERPFAFAAAAALERGASAVTIGDDGPLSIGLAALGLDVSALEPASDIAHPDVTVVPERIQDWGGPAEPLAAAFALSAPSQPSLDTNTRETVDLVRKWLRPTGLLVLGARVGPDQRMTGEDLVDLLGDWDVERRESFERDAGGEWRRSDESPRAGVVLLRATPRP